jgi:pyridoxal phosphate enzyme (YggS family)
MTAIQERYKQVLGEVHDLAKELDRPPPTVVVVSKNRSAAEIREVYEAGARDFAENQAQGFQDHLQELEDLSEVNWHFIGHLQTNKVSKVVGEASLIHSVDSVRLLECIDNRARRIKGEAVPLLLEVNISHEDSKYGFDPAGLPGAMNFVSRLEHIDVQGLMTMAPKDSTTEEVDKIFSDLRDCHKNLLKTSEGLYKGKRLSMGMSSDFRSAIRQGATIVRIGTAIFEG